jgi:hypothetical protein
MMDARTVLLVAIGLCGLLITALSFAPWIRFENLGLDTVAKGDYVTVSIQGTEIGRVIGNDDVSIREAAEVAVNPCTCRGSIGDGHLTAVLGVVIAVAAATGIGWRGAIRGATLVAALGSLAVLIVSGYNAVTIWKALAAPEANSEFIEMSGDTTAGLWALVATSIASAILCGTVWALSVSKLEDGDDLADDEPIAEGMNGWA